jgi:TonB family protein
MAKENKIRASRTSRLCSLSFIVLCGLAGACAQDRTKNEINKEPGRLRVAVADFKALNADPQTAPLNMIFNQTLWSDLDHIGIFDLIEKKFYPPHTPSQPADLNWKLWVEPPRSADILIVGNVSVNSGKIEVQGWLYDVKNAGAPPILRKQYKEDATPANVEMIAHHFADAIIMRQSGGSKYDWYVNSVKQQVQQNWLLTRIDPTLKTARRICVKFDIMGDGSPANVHLAQSSGVPFLDQSAMRAIQRIDSFGPTPEGNTVAVDFWFDYPTK